MTWIINRPATSDDFELLDKRAAAFVERHQIVLDAWQLEHSSIHSVLEDYLEQLHYTSYETPRLYKLWRRIVKRAIGDEGIAWGHVGRHA